MCARHDSLTILEGIGENVQSGQQITSGNRDKSGIWTRDSSSSSFLLRFSANSKRMQKNRSETRWKLFFVNFPLSQIFNEKSGKIDIEQTNERRRMENVRGISLYAWRNVSTNIASRLVRCSNRWKQTHPTLDRKLQLSAKSIKWESRRCACRVWIVNKILVSPCRRVWGRDKLEIGEASNFAGFRGSLSSTTVVESRWVELFSLPCISEFENPFPAN